MTGAAWGRPERIIGAGWVLFAVMLAFGGYTLACAVMLVTIANIVLWGHR